MTREEIEQRQIKTGHKEILLQPESGQQFEQSSCRSRERRVRQKFKECIRPLVS